MTENQLLDLTRRYGSKDKALAEMDSIELQLNDRSVYPQEGKIETISGVIDTSRVQSVCVPCSPIKRDC